MIFLSSLSDDRMPASLSNKDRVSGFQSAKTKLSKPIEAVLEDPKFVKKMPDLEKNLFRSQDISIEKEIFTVCSEANKLVEIT